MPAQLGAKFEPENWHEWTLKAGTLTAMSCEKSSHEKTWANNGHPLWEALREAGEAIRKMDAEEA